MLDWWLLGLWFFILALGIRDGDEGSEADEGEDVGDAKGRFVLNPIREREHQTCCCGLRDAAGEGVIKCVVVNAGVSLDVRFMLRMWLIHGHNFMRNYAKTHVLIEERASDSRPACGAG